ncbi:hypothetical protein [Pseudomonas sp. CBZ-4]|uniref:hypothetical protein n=1 Tax=Pseudomonas sp. CBZ-4 TaxID=1163065 RepID=UPI000349BC4C|nr:hypothetical protein [Pseudomonas sp. CBZ-4]
MSDYTELKRLAEAAQYENCEFQHELVAATKAFFVGCIPEQILALIAENESAHKHWQNESNNVQVLVAEVARLKVENEALRKECDARHPFKPFHEPAIGFTGCVICGVYTDHGGLSCPKTRATADAAMGKGEQS